jgi:hypothetical protein
MRCRQKLTIPKTTLRSITTLVATAAGNREKESDLYCYLQRLKPHQQAELLALVMLGRTGHRSFNVALDAAKKQNPEHIAWMLAEKSNFHAHLTKGLKRHARQS